eukprot:m.65947 g.65947  ORF g.65947 m.65947 type:complete len:350 (-) comp8173_c2_seq1:529-1578(-)
MSMLMMLLMLLLFLLMILMLLLLLLSHGCCAQNVSTTSTTVASNVSNVSNVSSSSTATTSPVVVSSTPIPDSTSMSTILVPNNSSNRASFNSTISPYFLPPALPGLFLCFVGYRYIEITLFLVGAIFSGAVFFEFSPQMFPHSSFCCGDRGSLAGKIVCSCIVAILAGLIFKEVYSLGLFIVGVAMGLVLALAIHMTPLKDDPSFQSRGAVIGLYVGCAVLMGAATLYFKKFFSIITTSIGGALLFLLGVEYFAKTDFGSIVLYCLETIARALRNDVVNGQEVNIQFNVSVANKVYYMIAAWGVLAIVGIVVQFNTGERDSRVRFDQHSFIYLNFFFFFPFLLGVTPYI